MYCHTVLSMCISDTMDTDSWLVVLMNYSNPTHVSIFTISGQLPLRPVLTPTAVACIHLSLNAGQGVG